MTGITLIVLILGAYRVWMLLAKDAITEPLRQRVLGYSLGADGQYHRNRWPNPHRKIAEMVDCAWCLGAWLSLLVYVAWKIAPRETMWVVTPFAISAGVALIATCFDRLVLDRD